MAKVAFIGLGAMGYPMAGHLAAAGHEVTVYNRTRRKAELWLSEHAGALADTPAAAARGAEAVFTCVGDDPDLAEVVLGHDGIVEGLAAGGVIVDHTTTSADLARRLAEALAERDIAFIDAPVSGGQVGALNGKLTVMAGGDADAWQRVEPLIRCFAHAATLMGDSGAGQLTKMVNQVCVAGLLQGLAEGLAFGQRAGLDMDKVIDVISRGAAQSWQMDNRAPTMCAGDYDFGFAVDWMRKDLRIVLDEARNNGASLPVAALVDQFYAEVQQFGGGRWDTSSLMLRLAPVLEEDDDE